MAAPAPPRLRVLHVVPSFFPAVVYGGPAICVYELARAQQAAGHEVRVLTSDANGRDAEGRAVPLRGLGGPLASRWVTEYGVPTYYAKVRLGEDLAPRLVPLVLEGLRECDLVHVTGVFSATSLLGLAMASLSLGRRRPVVLSPNGALMPWALARRRERKQAVLRMLAPLLRMVTGWHVTSVEEEQSLFDTGLVRAGAEVAVIPNGAALPAAGSLCQKTPDALKLLTLGRLHPVKNLELALATLAELRRRGHEATLTLAGPATPGDRYPDTLLGLAERLGVRERIRLPGLVLDEEKRRLLAESDVLLLSSHMENFGNVVIEALAHGTPVVAVQGTPWQILATARVGAHVTPTPQAMADAVLALREAATQDPAALAERCRTLVADRYTWPAVARHMDELYRRVIAKS